MDLGGLEPPTSRLSGVRSNQLSYRSILGRGRRTRTLDIWFWRPTFCQLNYTPKAIKLAIYWCLEPELNQRHTELQSVALPTELSRLISKSIKKKYLNGGEGGSRTLARFHPPNALAVRPLRPLEYFSKTLAEEVGFEPTCAFTLTVFKTAPLWPLRYPSVLNIILKNGDPSEARTPDTLVKSQVLYLLS